MASIRPHSLDPQTLERLHELVATTYAGRDDLYKAAAHLQDKELSEICEKLAEDLATNSAHLAQILAMHGREPNGKNAVQTALTEEIVRYLREQGRDKEFLSAAEKAERGVRERYDATIASTENPEAQALLKKQREEAAFGEKVLRHLTKDEGGEATPRPK